MTAAAITEDTLFCALLLQQAYRYSERPHVARTTDVMTGAVTVYVAVKGTDGLADLWTDLRRRQVRFLGTSVGWAHEGFNEVVEGLVGSGKLCAEFEGASRIVFTGHSLGGAVASLLAVVYAALYPTVAVEEVTFGSPRVCNRRLAKHHDAIVGSVLRIMHDRDPVPRVPLFGYRHVKGRVVFGDNGKLMTPIKGGWHTLLFWLGFRKRDMADHLLATYVTSIEKYLAAERQES